MSVTTETAPATLPISRRPDAAGDDHEVTRPRQTKRWVDWVTTTDHKKIGILYLVTTFVFFGLGGIEALLMRTPARRSEQHPAVGPALQPAADACTAPR